MIADAWRGFVPEEDTDRSVLRQRIDRMLTRLAAGGHCNCDQSATSRILRSWTFPLWPFELQDSSRGAKLAELREERRLTIEWIEKTEARRDPPPAITRDKVVSMSRAYKARRDECERVDTRRGYKAGKMHIHSSTELANHVELNSYKTLEARSDVQRIGSL